MQICRTNERTSSLLCLCRQLKHSFSSDRATWDSETRLSDRRIKRKKKENSLERRECFFFFSFSFFLTDRYTQVIRRVWQESSFRWKLLGETSRVISDTGGCGSILERSVRFLEKDEKGNVNSSTRVPLHPVRAKSVSLFIRGKREISLDCKFHIHVGLLINTLPASASSEREWGFFYYYYQSFLSFDSRFTTT